MKDEAKTKRQLIKELAEMRRRIAELEETPSELKASANTWILSEEWYQVLFNNVSDAVFVHWGPDETNMPGTFIEVNAAACKKLGYTREELLQMRPSDIDAPETISNIPVMMKKLLKDKQALWEGVHVSKDHQKMPVEIHNRLFGSGGRTLILSTVRDITVRKRTEEALRKSQQLLKRTFASLRDAIFIIDADTSKITECNPAASEIFGYGFQEMLGRKTEFLHVDEAALTEFRRRLYSDVEVKGFLFLPEFVMKRENGTVFPTEHSVTPVEDEEGKRLGWVSVVRDITDRKLAEEALRESEEKYRLVVENAGEAIAVIQDGMIKFVNPRAVDMLGYSIEELTSRAIPEFIHPDDRKMVFERHMRRTNNEDVSSVYALKAVAKDGTVKWAEVHATLVSWNGKPATLSFFLDITDRKRAEEALKASELKYQAIFENTGTTMLIVEEDMTISLANDGFENLTGYKREEVEGKKKWTEFVEKGDLERMIAQHQLRRVDSDLAKKNYEFKLILRDGHFKDILLTVDVIPGTKKSIASLMDITDRKRAEEALRKAEREKSAILDAMSELVIYLDTDMKVIWSNSAMNRQFNMKSSQIEGRYCYEALHKMNRPCRICPVVKAIETGEPYIIDDFSSLDKRWTLRAYPVRNEEGNLVGVVEMVTDITDRKCAEDELRQALLDLQELNFIVNKSPAIAFLWRAADNWPVEFVSGNIAQFGYMPDDFTSGRIPFALIVHCDDLKRIADEVTHYTQDGRTEFTQEYRIITKSGEVRWIDDRTWIRRDVDGQITHYQGIVLDITERKRLEERLHRAEKMEAIGTLAGGVAHDLNNVLGIVVGYSELLLDKLDESSTIRSYAMNVMKGGERAAAIVQDLLTLARRGVHVEKIVNLNTTINDFQKSPEFEKLCSFHSKVQIKTDLKPDLLNISGSPVHLGKTFFNLVSNASEAMPNGGVLTITTSNQYLDRPIQGYDDVKEGDYVVLSVSDTGEGIPASDVKRIFEPFYTKKVMGRSGTGLGLAVVWGTVKDHNGYINVQSEEEKGTTFILYFPVAREEVTKDQMPVSVSEYMGNGESILVVDDVEGQRELASHMLKKLNYSAATVSSGEEAIEYLKANEADLVILDMIMDPGIDGLDTYRKILEIKPKQKAIIVSGFSETVRVNQAQALGAGAYIKKPYVLERLGLAVRKELDKPAKYSYLRKD